MRRSRASSRCLAPPAPSRGSRRCTILSRSCSTGTSPASTRQYGILRELRAARRRSSAGESSARSAAAARARRACSALPRSESHFCGRDTERARGDGRRQRRQQRVFADAQRRRVGANGAVAVGDGLRVPDRGGRPREHRSRRGDDVGRACARAARRVAGRKQPRVAIRVFHPASRRGGRPPAARRCRATCIACARCASGSRPALDSPSSRRSCCACSELPRSRRFEQRECCAQALRFAGARRGIDGHAERDDARARGVEVCR